MCFHTNIKNDKIMFFMAITFYYPLYSYCVPKNPLTSFLSPPHLPLIVTLNPSHRLSQGICSAVLMIRMRSFMLVKYYYSALSRILWIIEKYLGSRHFKSSVLNNRILLPFKPCSQCLLHYRCHLLGIHSFKILITDSLWKLKANTGIAV